MLNYYALADRVTASYVEAPKGAFGHEAPTIIRVADDIRLVLDQRADELLVVIPGTTDDAGWMDDFATFPRHFAELGWYHEGFGSKGLALFGALEPHLPVPGHGMLTTYVGHSLGAALARVLAILHARSFFGTHRLVTLGEPRGAALWNFRARTYLRSARDIKRFVRAADPIPHVPLPPLYQHTSRGSALGTPTGSIDLMTNHNIDLYRSDLKFLGI
jgi:pimeloyl-ACP methyl ester carboxylesterase